MKLSVTTLGWMDATLDQILADIKSVGGFAGIDFRGLGSGLDITAMPEFNEKLGDTLAKVKAAGLVPSGLCTSTKLIADAKGNRAEDEVARYCKLADRMGVKAIRVFGGKRRKDQSRDAWMAEGVETLKRLCAQTEGSGAELLIETHDDWCHSADVAELIGKVDHRRARVLWDVLITQLMGKETPEQTAANVGPLVRYTHVKDGYVKGEAFGISVPGTGEVDMAGAVRQLKKIGYNGWLTFEWEKRWHKEIPSAVEGMKAYRKVVEPAM